jgi:hypothetical protein
MIRTTVACLPIKCRRGTLLLRHLLVDLKTTDIQELDKLSVACSLREYKVDLDDLGAIKVATSALTAIQPDTWHRLGDIATANDGNRPAPNWSTIGQLHLEIPGTAAQGFTISAIEISDTAL